jgi:hypothetical protein
VPKIKTLYENAGLPLNEKTLFEFQDKDLIGEPRPLAGAQGENSVVFEASFRRDGDEREFHAVIKKDRHQGQEEVLPYAHRLIGLSATQLAVRQLESQRRNLATYAINRLFGWDVIPRTGIAYLDGELVLFMEFVRGIHPSKSERVYHVAQGREKQDLMIQWKEFKENPGLYGRILAQNNFRNLFYSGDKFRFIAGERHPDLNYDDPTLIEESIKLQLLYAITGAVDCQNNNVIVEFKEGRISGLKGVDNDLSCGEKMATFEESAGKAGAFVFDWPPVITEQVHSDLMNITPAKIEETLNGLASAPEIKARIAALERAHQHVRHLHDSGNVVERSALANIADDPRFTPANSLLSRARMHLQQA